MLKILSYLKKKLNFQRAQIKNHKWKKIAKKNSTKNFQNNTIKYTLYTKNVSKIKIISKKIKKENKKSISILIKILKNEFVQK